MYRHLKDARRAGEVQKEPAPADAFESTPHLRVTLEPFEGEEKELRRMWAAGALEEPSETKKWRAETWENEWYFASPRFGQLRHRWERTIGRRDFPTATIGVAWAVSVLVNGAGLPFRATTVEELASFSGFHWSTVREAMERLEEGRWIRTDRSRGRGGGITPFLWMPREELVDLLRP